VRGWVSLKEDVTRRKGAQGLYSKTMLPGIAPPKYFYTYTLSQYVRWRGGNYRMRLKSLTTNRDRGGGNPDTKSSTPSEDPDTSKTRNESRESSSPQARNRHPSAGARPRTIAHLTQKSNSGNEYPLSSCREPISTHHEGSGPGHQVVAGTKGTRWPKPR